MQNHQAIDARSLAMARAIVKKIDADPKLHGLIAARNNCTRWLQNQSAPAILEWKTILAGSWNEIRARLLDPSEEGVRLRQSNPFCGVLSPRERWTIHREFSDEPQAA